MAKWVRLWGKKRGTRMSGWWVVGSVSEAAFYGALFLLGIVSLTIVVSGQVFWPESTILRPWFGFWLMVIASSSFIVIGLTAFVIGVSRTLASPEKRSAMASKVKQSHLRRSDDEAPVANLPSLESLTDSPGVKLAYRLAIKQGERSHLILSMLFTVAWNAMVAVLAVVAVQKILSQGPDWFLNVLLVGFGTVSFFTTKWFFQLFRRHTGIGPTAVEIDQLPLLPGREVQLYLCQYGRIAFTKLSLSLICFEEATYQQGTDVRTERRETCRIAAELDESKSEDLVAEPEKPLELGCKINLPDDIMHSFQSEHNAVVWRIVVEGDAPKWPSFCRNFPVVVYPQKAV